MRKRTFATLVAVASLVVSATSVSADSGWESTDVFGQGISGPVVAAGGAAILRSPNSVAASLSMSTPEPGSYRYPTGPTGSGIAGHPEAFSLWAFVFFNPEACAGPVCLPGDLMNNPNVIAGAYNAGGHIEGGPNLHLQGSVNKSRFTFGGPNAETLGEALAMGYDLADAEIHLAVAPHGALDPTLLPGAISTPVGNPTFWWLAIFPPSN